MKFITSIIDYIFPIRCYSCNEISIIDKGLCNLCFKELEFIASPYCIRCGAPFNIDIQANTTCRKCTIYRPEYDYCRSIFKFNNASKKLIYSFKYSDRTSCAEYFARLLLNKYSKEFSRYHYICPVPMHRYKRLFRKYNPPQILSNEITKRLDSIIHIPDLLIKQKYTKSQTYLNKEEREQNIIGSIIFNRKYNIKNKKIILVDDVHTTGATSKLCSKILKQNGATSVFFLSISRT